MKKVTTTSIRLFDQKAIADGFEKDRRIINEYISKQAIDPYEQLINENKDLKKILSSGSSIRLFDQKYTNFHRKERKRGKSKDYYQSELPISDRKYSLNEWIVLYLLNKEPNFCPNWSFLLYVYPNLLMHDVKSLLPEYKKHILDTKTLQTKEKSLKAITVVRLAEEGDKEEVIEQMNSYITISMFYKLAQTANNVQLSISKQTKSP